MCSSFFSFFFLRVSTNKNSKGSTVTKASFYLNLFERGQKNKIKNSFPAVSHPVSPLDQRLKKKNLNNKRLKTIIFILHAPVSPGFHENFKQYLLERRQEKMKTSLTAMVGMQDLLVSIECPATLFPLKKKIIYRTMRRNKRSDPVIWPDWRGGKCNEKKKKKKASALKLQKACYHVLIRCAHRRAHFFSQHANKKKKSKKGMHRNGKPSNKQTDTRIRSELNFVCFVSLTCHLGRPAILCKCGRIISPLNEN